MDLNANLHGNWTLENAKARLNQFFQKEKISTEYKYSQVGPDHNRSEPSVQPGPCYSVPPHPSISVVCLMNHVLLGQRCMFFC